jgi:hypothetical protein
MTSILKLYFFVIIFIILLVKKFLAFYRTQRFITMFTTANMYILILFGMIFYKGK